MPEVTINAADLEALLFAAGAANANPEARKILKHDVQFEQVEGRLADAIKRAGDEWRKAYRADAFPERFQVDEHEIAFLKRLAEKGALFRFGMKEPLDDLVPRSYVTKMLIEYGVYTESIAWSTSGDVDRMQHAERRVRLTADAFHILKTHYASHVTPVEPMELAGRLAELPTAQQTERMKAAAKRFWLFVKAWLRLDLQAVCEASKGRDWHNDFHDYPDSVEGGPWHFSVLTCKRCGKRFII